MIEMKKSQWICNGPYTFKLHRTKNVQIINLSAINVREKSEGKFTVLSVILSYMKLFENVKNDKCSSSQCTSS